MGCLLLLQGLLLLVLHGGEEHLRRSGVVVGGGKSAGGGGQRAGELRERDWRWCGHHLGRFRPEHAVDEIIDTVEVDRVRRL